MADYVGSPYNFIPFEKETYAPVGAGEMGVHDKLDAELLSGEISYTIEAKTPIMIDSGKGTFFKNECEQYAIPGSTMRGLLRNNVQILSASSFDKDIDDYNLMYRHVANGALKDEYNIILGNTTVSYGKGNISVLGKVKGGEITCENGTYYLYFTKIQHIADNDKLPNYYVLSERTIVEDYLKNQSGSKFSDLWSKNSGWSMQHKHNCPFIQYFSNAKKVQEGQVNNQLADKKKKVIYYKKVDKKEKKVSYILSKEPVAGYAKGALYCEYKNRINMFLEIIGEDGKEEWVTGRIEYRGTMNKDYKPFFSKCYYSVSGKDITALYAAPHEGTKEGYLIGSGPMNGKKVLYVIPEIDYDSKHEIHTDDIKAFKIDFKKKANTLRHIFMDDNEEDKEKADQEAEKYYGLPKEGEKKPIFCIPIEKPDKEEKKNTDRYYFGFTPRIRLFYKHNIKTGYKQVQPKENEFDLATSIFGLAEDYKSKISVCDAIYDGREEPMREPDVVLAEPKPTSYLDYLDQTNGTVTYNSDEFSLRGAKQYWLRDRIYLGKQNSEKSNSGSSMNPLPVGSRFKGTIRFDNLTRKELGLLLWALRLEKESCMNIGKGKPYGYGVIAVSNIKAKTLDIDKAYGFDSISFDPFEAIDVDKLINEYKSTEVFGHKICELESVKAFFDMKNGDKKPDPNNIRYMSIDDKEYQRRVNGNIPLMSIQEVLSGKPPQSKAVTNKPNKANNQNKEKKNEETIVTIKYVRSDEKKPNLDVGFVDPKGIVFNIPKNAVKPGDKVKVKITNTEKQFGNYIGKA